MKFSLVIDVCPENIQAIQHLLDRLFVHNLATILYRRDSAQTPVPALYSSGVRYQSEPNVGVDGERFDDLNTVLARGWGDCDDLSAWRAAELCADRIPARALVVEIPGSIPGRRRYHCVVQYINGSIEDPSIRLGMRT